MKAHGSHYFIDMGVIKMYRDLKGVYLWSVMIQDITKYEYIRPARLLEKMSIPKWKWEKISMDFMVGLPKTLGKLDSI